MRSHEALEVAFLGGPGRLTTTHALRRQTPPGCLCHLTTFPAEQLPDQAGPPSACNPGEPGASGSLGTARRATGQGQQSPSGDPWAGGPSPTQLCPHAQAPRGHPVLLGKLVTTSMGLRLKLCPGQGSAACQRYPPLSSLQAGWFSSYRDRSGRTESYVIRSLGPGVLTVGGRKNTGSAGALAAPKPGPPVGLRLPAWAAQGPQDTGAGSRFPYWPEGSA
ncbi:hypothetical protein CB1_000303012 [Camelus ferus]|nr:hypothetical protein CB1_000303012 [Camelus ferus]